MASLPAQPASWRQSSPEETPSTPTPASSSQDPRSSSRPRSTISEDSQTVLLNTPTPEASQEPVTKPSTSSTPQPQDDADIKKCWICFADETEDLPSTSEWRSPCPCALVAHEDCLLDWIADMESPSSRKRTLGAPKLLCPQCKSEIHLARPRDLVVEAVRASERIAAKVVTPAAISVALSTVVHGCQLHGIHSIYMIFGQDDAWRILEPLLDPRRWTRLWDLRSAVESGVQHWRLYLGLPLITPMLVLSRTKFVDSVLPVLPIVFFATQGDADSPMDLGHWPPSASMAMAVLPYLRGIYNAYYQRVWAVHEKRWLKEIQPRNGQSGSNDEGNEGQNQNAGDADEANDDDDEGTFEIRVDGNIWDDWEDDEGANDREQARNRQEEERRMEAEREAIRQDIQGNDDGLPVPPDAQAPPLNAPPLADNDEPAPAPNVPRQQQRPQPQPQPPVVNAERRLSFTTTGLAEKVLGALLFPTIASLSGEALRLTLPLSWTSTSIVKSTTANSLWERLLGKTTSTTIGKTKPTGLLQEKWGRSIIGGCLFVVVKDAVMLYVRWKMAQQHRRRRVLDFDRRKGRGVGVGGRR